MKYVIVDIDGTVALHKMPDGSLLRGHHEYDRVGEDMPNTPIIRLVQAMDENHSIIFLSGRPDRVRQQTEDWLHTHVVYYGDPITLFMRKDGDYRGDDVVKEELMVNEVEPFAGGRENILFAIDDRPRVIRKWAELGIYVIDVQPLSGEF